MFNSNLECWKKMQEEGYFEKHPRYKGLNAFGKETISMIERFTKLQPHYKIAIIGCGYGREVIQLSPYIKHVYGIDVNETILQKARTFTSEHGVENFTGVLADNWKKDLPTNLNLIYAMVVMQHLTRDLVHDYFAGLGEKLSPSGLLIVQFLEKITDIYYDTKMKDFYEPQVTWTVPQIREMAEGHGWEVKEIQTAKVHDTAFWHWCCFTRDEE